MIKKEFLRVPLRLLPDSIYISLVYFKHFKKFPNLRNPLLYNEKLQWLKLHDRKTVYTTMVDKVAAKRFISETIGSKYVVPLLGTWDNADSINYDILPEQFVLKTNHDSKGVLICKNKSSFDFDAAKKFLNKHLRKNGFWYGREWPYKNVKPQILAEVLLSENDNEALTDYKFFCFNGNAKIMYISKDGAKHATTDFYDMEFNHLDIRMKDEPASTPPHKPESFEEMRRIAETISVGIPHLRVDFYEINGCPYIGELTFYHNSGFGRVTPDSWNYKLGSWINV